MRNYRNTVRGGLPALIPKPKPVLRLSPYDRRVRAVREVLEAQLASAELGRQALAEDCRAMWALLERERRERVSLVVRGDGS